MNLLQRISFICMITLIMAAGTTLADEEKDAEKRAEIDAMAADTLKELFAANTGAKDLYGMAYGHAVFDNLKIAIGISGGGG